MSNNIYTGVVEDPNEWDIGIENPSDEESEVMILPNAIPSSSLDTVTTRTNTIPSALTPRSLNESPVSPRVNNINSNNNNSSANTPKSVNSDDIELRDKEAWTDADEDDVDDEDVEEQNDPNLVSEESRQRRRRRSTKNLDESIHVESIHEDDFNIRSSNRKHQLKPSDNPQQYMFGKHNASFVKRYSKNVPSEYEVNRQMDLIAREEQYEVLKDKHALKEYIREYTRSKSTRGMVANSKYLEFFRRSKEIIVDWWAGRSISTLMNRLRIFAWIIQTVEKNFGSGIASFYEFFVNIIYINALTFVITFLLLILPWLIGYHSWRKPEDWGKGSGKKFMKGLVGFDSSQIGKTWFYYGGYPLSYQVKDRVHWSFTFWYPAAIILYYVISVIILVRAIGKRLRRVNSLTSGSYIYLNAVFNTWDHNTYEEKGIQQMKRSIATRLVERLKHDELMEGLKRKKTKKEMALMYLRRISGVIVSLILIAAGPIIVGLVGKYYDHINKGFPYTTSVITSAINIIFPIIIKYMVKLEGYKNREVEDNNVVGRTYIVKMTTTIALMIRVLYPNSKQTKGTTCVANNAGLVFWQMLLIDLIVCFISSVFGSFLLYRIRKITIKDEEDESVGRTEKVKLTRRQRVSSIFASRSSADEDEPEEDKEEQTQKKQETGEEVPADLEQPEVTGRKRILNLFKKKNTKSNRYQKTNKALIEFDVPTNVIELMYRQSIIWIGTIMSPMIPLLGVLICLILFFSKWITMKFTAGFPSNPIADGRSSPYNFILLLFTMVLSGIPAIVFMLRDAESACGPHINSEGLTPSEMMSRSWNNNVVFKNVSGVRDWFNFITYYAFHPVTLVITIITLAVFAYFLFMRMRMFRARMINAESDAKMERDDKQFLLNRYIEAI